MPPVISVRNLVKTYYTNNFSSADDAPFYMHASLGYTLTCHKSQGSEWPSSVIMMEPSVRIGTVEGRRWLYTALTRARERARVCWVD